VPGGLTDPRFGTSGSPLGPPTPPRPAGPVYDPDPPTVDPLPRHNSAALAFRPLPGTGPVEGDEEDWPLDAEDEGTRRLPLRVSPPPPRSERTGHTGRLPVAGPGWRDEDPDDEPRYGGVGRSVHGSGSLPGGSLDPGLVGGPVRAGRLAGGTGGAVGSWVGDGSDDLADDLHEPGSGGAGRRRGWARGVRRPTRKQTPLGQAFGAVSEVVVVVALALTLALVIKTFLVQAFFIPSGSMENTLLTGDRVLVSKLTPGVFDLHRGDVVVFKDPGGWLDPTQKVDEGPIRNGIRESLTFVGLLPQDSGEHLIKRVIGLPGDTVSCAGPGQPVKVNGVALSEPYLFPGNDPSDKQFSETVPAGHLWVLGDHRAISEDSRWHPHVNHGFVPIKDVVGKAFVIVWPLGRAAMLGIPDTVFARVPDPTSTPASAGS
jgi:signal peptidase I